MHGLFVIDKWDACEITADDLPALQLFFAANPEYFHAVNGMPPREDEAWQEFNDRPPAGMPYERQVMIGIFDQQWRLAYWSVYCGNPIARQWRCLIHLYRFGSVDESKRGAVDTSGCCAW